MKPVFHSVFFGTLFVGAVLGSTVHANDEQFAKNKADMVERLDKRITMLNEAKACVSSAADQASMAKCRSEIRGDMMEHRKDMKGKHRERIDGRIKRLEEQKARMDGAGETKESK